ncbi:MAG: class I SAM-dependent methyltransferase, partial [Caloramator sp.]|nr:class I SAM-dependent methyltransferase [Caloramator sp.]
MAHDYVKNVVKNDDIVVDATLGNGNDTLFLSSLVSDGMVYAFEVQRMAVEKFNIKMREDNINNVEVILDGHENMDKYIDKTVKAVMFNLGYLPGADKSVTTKTETTLIALEKSLKLLQNGGIITIAAYIGHEEGSKESMAVLDYIKTLDPKAYSVMQISYINRNNAPFLVVIEKNDSYHED